MNPLMTFKTNTNIYRQGSALLWVSGVRQKASLVLIGRRNCSRSPVATWCLLQIPPTNIYMIFLKRIGCLAKETVSVVKEHKTSRKIRTSNKETCNWLKLFDELRELRIKPSYLKLVYYVLNQWFKTHVVWKTANYTIFVLGLFLKKKKHP